MIADSRAVLDINSIGFIDENTHQPASIGKFQVDEFIPQRAHRFF